MSELPTNEKITAFTDLRVWQSGHRLVILIYKMTEAFPSHEQYGLANQIRRASVSITSNIAEGFRRDTYKDKARFYSMAAASLTEVENQLLVARDVGYLVKDQYLEANGLATDVSKMLHGLQKATREKIRSSTFDLRHSTQQGASLVEVVIATGLVATVVVALLLTILFAVQTNIRAERDTVAAEIAHQQLEAIRHLPIASLANQVDGALIGAPGPDLAELPTATGTLTIADYDGDPAIKLITVTITYRDSRGDHTTTMETIIGTGGISG